MFLHAASRCKNGKVHRYFSVVENRRVAGGNNVQRQVMYLGEINDSQQDARCKDPAKGSSDLVSPVSSGQPGLFQFPLALAAGDDFQGVFQGAA